MNRPNPLDPVRATYRFLKRPARKIIRHHRKGKPVNTNHALEILARLRHELRTLDSLCAGT